MGLVKSMTAALRSRRAAQSEVTRLEQKIVDLRGEADGKREELARLEASVGERVLADPSAARTLAVDAQELRFLIAGAQAASQAAERQLAEAREELALAQAAEKRQEAAKLQAEVDAHQARVDELLTQLEVLDGVRYVPYSPSAEDRQYALQENRPLSWELPRSVPVLDRVADLLAEAEALEGPVLQRRAARERATMPLVPSAQIHVPSWNDLNGDSTLSCVVSEGVGSATFEIGSGGHFETLVTLPDENGRRSWSQTLRIPPGAGVKEIRCNGEVLAKAERPGRLKNDGFARWWVELN